MRKKIFFTILALASVAVLYFVVIFFKNYLFGEEETDTPVYGEKDYFTHFLNEELPTDIVWIGRKCEYEQDYGEEYAIPVREENEITEETLMIRDGFVRMLVVIDDLDDAVELSDEELALMQKYIALDNRYNFVYVGKKLEQVCDAFSLDYETTIRSEDLSISFFRTPDRIISGVGVYTATEVTNNMPVYAAVFLDYQISAE